MSFEPEQEKNSFESEGDYADALEDAEMVRKYGTIEVDEAKADEPGREEDGFELPFTISTEAIDRDNDTINPLGWKLKEFKKNPVVLWAHDARQPPVGRAPKTFIDREKKTLRSVAQFPSADLYEFGNMVGRLFKHKFMRAVSVGFYPLEFKRNEERGGFAPTDFIKQNLLEYSAVPVPSNPEALIEARSVGINLEPMVSWAEKILDGEGALIVPRHMLEEIHNKARGDSVSVHVKLDLDGDQEPDVDAQDGDDVEDKGHETEADDLDAMEHKLSEDIETFLQKLAEDGLDKDQAESVVFRVLDDAKSVVFDDDCDNVEKDQDESDWSDLDLEEIASLIRSEVRGKLKPLL